MIRILEIVAIVAAVLGGLLFLAGLGASNSAPQEGALAGMVLVIVTVPYCLASILQRRRILQLLDRDR
jgi:ABC-type glucose/galactose transport system permease subunit